MATTNETEMEIEELAQEIEFNSVPMAVVDYGSECPFEERFGTRDMRRRAAYGLNAVRLNQAARTGTGEF